MRTHVDLFSGIGGFSLACKWAGVETIAFSEIDPYASRVLQRHWPGIRNFGDVRSFPSMSAWLLTAGVPCQPASVAGKRQGAADDRWLWPETLAVVENGTYEWLLFENPTGILSLNDGLEFEGICAALEGQGYEVQPLIVPACSVGAPHRRNRVWILAHSKGERRRPGRTERSDSSGAGQPEQPCSLVADASCGGVEGERVPAEGQVLVADANRSGANVAHADNAGSQGRIGAELRECPCQRTVGPCGSSVPDAYSEPLGRATKSWCQCNQWTVEPDVGRVANGIPARVDRLRGLGNAIVPQVAFQLIKRMIEAEEKIS